MHLNTAGTKTRRTVLSWHVAVLLAFMLGLWAIGVSRVQAQDATPGAATDQASPEASPEALPGVSIEATPAADQTPASVTTLLQYQLDEFPTPPVSIRLLRMTLQPGASSPLHTHPGFEFDLVESGTLTVRADGEAVVTRAGTPEPVPAEGTTVNPSEFVVFPPGTGMNLINESDQELVLLSAVFHPVNEDVPSTTYTDGEPAADAFDGVSFVVLGDGILQEFPTGATTITLENIVVPAGTDLPASNGAALYSKIDGNFSFVVNTGTVQVSRSASPGLRPNAAPEQEFTLETSDGAFFPEGVGSSSRSGETGNLSFLRLSAQPAEPLTAEPAAITFISGAAADTPSDGTAAGADQPTEIGVGATVATNTDSVNLREEPSIDAEVIDQLGNGVELLITDGPIEADDFVWYFVEVVGTEGPTEGWVAQDFISLPGAAPAETPEPTEAAGATPAAADDETFAEGDAVVANDDNVRVRDEASTGGDIIEAYPAGTEFVVIGEPVEADGFTWYPVQLADDEAITGFIAADFLDAAP